MRLALFSNVTCEVLAKELASDFEVWCPPGYGGWMECSLAPPAELVEFRPQALCLVLDGVHADYSELDRVRAVTALSQRFPAARVFTVLSPLPCARAFYDERLWTLASMPWSLAAVEELKAEILRQTEGVLPSAAGRFKALAIDFDGTLWQGVVGEDGVAALVMRPHLQRTVRKLVERGVALVGLSKNNLADVEPVWRDRRCLLTAEDFSLLKVDWNGKAENLAAAAAELNLGTDAFVFLDDNPAERERMRAAFPELAVVDWTDELEAVAALNRLFPALVTTEDDRARPARYRDEARRRALKLALPLEEYLRTLRIRTRVHRLREDELERVAQLSARTNQFNVLTRRRSLSELRQLKDDPTRMLFAAYASDRFGDQGLIAFVQAEVDGSTARLVDWVMSCRAMNRRIEHSVEQAVERALKAAGVATLTAVWRRTAKNAPVRRLFDELGFTLVAATDDRREYAKRL